MDYKRGETRAIKFMEKEGITGNQFMNKIKKQEAIKGKVEAYRPK